MTSRNLVQTGFYLSFATSAAFNVYGAILATGNPAGWVFSALWSAFAFIAVEIMVKVKFPSLTAAQRKAGKRNLWPVVRFGGVGFVAIGSFVISYGHIYHSMINWNQGTLASVIAPLVVDGFLTLTSLTLMVLPVPRATKRK